MAKPARGEKKIDRFAPKITKQIRQSEQAERSSRKTFAKLLNNNKLKLFTKLTLSRSLSLAPYIPIFLSLPLLLCRSCLNLVDGEYKQKSATQTPSGHLSTTSEVEISCKPGSTVGGGGGVGGGVAAVGASSSMDSGAYQSSKVSYNRRRPERTVKPKSFAKLSLQLNDCKYFAIVTKKKKNKKFNFVSP